MEMKNESVEEYLKRGGKIKKVHAKDSNLKFRFGSVQTHRLSPEAKKVFLARKNRTLEQK